MLLAFEPANRLFQLVFRPTEKLHTGQILTGPGSSIKNSAQSRSAFLFSHNGTKEFLTGTVS
tara:strand:- start:345833 stop:346018 length:186 start_codon:yes stop_codon:yes gene_type:complete